MENDEVRAILDKKLSVGGGMSFFPVNLGFKELNYCEVVGLDFSP